jgi:hypothetical protein
MIFDSVLEFHAREIANRNRILANKAGREFLVRAPLAGRLLPTAADLASRAEQDVIQRPTFGRTICDPAVASGSGNSYEATEEGISRPISNVR